MTWQEVSAPAPSRDSPLATGPGVAGAAPVGDGVPPQSPRFSCRGVRRSRDRAGRTRGGGQRPPAPQLLD